MKKLFVLLIISATTFTVQAEEVTDADNASDNQSLLDLFSFGASFGTSSVAPSDLGNTNLANITMGELNLSFKTTGHISVGVSMTGPLGNCNSGYFVSEGAFNSFQSEDDDEDEDKDMEDDDDQDDCEDGINSIMGTFTYKLSDQVPVFVQASGGYAISASAPAYSVLVGYHQKLFSALGITAGIRFSDILYKIPAEAVSVTSSSGLKAELGLSWNF